MTVCLGLASEEKAAEMAEDLAWGQSIPVKVPGTRVWRA